jgi:IS1 family transposase
LAQKKGAQISDVLHKTILPYEEDDILELDEMWTFVEKKIHDYWLWIAICKRTKQIVSYHVGKRESVDCFAFWQKVPREYKKSLLYSDFYTTYLTVLKKYNHIAVGKDTGLTNHVERRNNTIRQRLGRLTRKTLSFSKCEQMLEINIRIFIHNYNEEKAKMYLNKLKSAR